MRWTNGDPSLLVPQGIRFPRGIVILAGAALVKDEDYISPCSDSTRLWNMSVLCRS